MPVGPHILWPEKARKSQPISCTSSGRCPALWAASTSVVTAELAGAGAEFGDGIDRAEGVGNVGEGEQLDLAGSGISSSRVRSSKPVSPVTGRNARAGAGPLGQQLPGNDVAVVLHFGEQDPVAGAEVLDAPGLSHQVDALGGAAGENDLVRAAGVDELRRRGRGRPRRRRWRGCSVRGCRGGRWRCRARNNGAGPRARRAASAWWRRCRSKSDGWPCTF